MIPNCWQESKNKLSNLHIVSCRRTTTAIQYSLILERMKSLPTPRISVSHSNSCPNNKIIHSQHKAISNKVQRKLTTKIERWEDMPIDLVYKIFGMLLLPTF